MPHNLQRFLSAQERDYPIALREIKNGCKYSHWIWYIFPQFKGLGHSYQSEYYGIANRQEAEAYLAEPGKASGINWPCWIWDWRTG